MTSTRARLPVTLLVLASLVFALLGPGDATARKKKKPKPVDASIPAYCTQLPQPLVSYAPCAAKGQSVFTVHDPGTPGDPRRTSMAIGRDGFPIIAVHDIGLQDLVVIKCNDRECRAPGEKVSTVLGADGLAGFAASIAIGTDGLPVISTFTWEGQYSSVVVKCNDTACKGADETVTELEGPLASAASSSIAIGTDGLPVIAYPLATGGVRIVRCDNPACTGSGQSFNSRDTGKSLASPSLAIGVDGFPVVAYHDTGAGDLDVLKCDDPACDVGGEVISSVDSTNNVGTGSSLAVAPDGNPVISYQDSTLLALKVAKCNDWGCEGANETVTVVDDPGNNVGGSSSIAIGTDGAPVVSYHNQTAKSLRFARCAAETCSPSTVTVVDDPANEVGTSTSIAIGTDGIAVMSYIDETADAVKVARVSS